MMDMGKALKKGNESMALGGICAISAATCPCPLCMIATAGFVLNGLRQKLL